MKRSNGRRRHRGHSRKNLNNLNKNTVLESCGPISNLRGSAFQLNEKYYTLASEANANDDKVLAESYLQFADHYYRLQKEIELNNENKDLKIKSELNSLSNNSSEIELDDNDKNSKKPSRRKRGFQIREAELSAEENNDQGNEIKNDKSEGDNFLI